VCVCVCVCVYVCVCVCVNVCAMHVSMCDGTDSGKYGTHNFLPYPHPLHPLHLPLYDVVYSTWAKSLRGREERRELCAVVTDAIVEEGAAEAGVAAGQM